MSKQKEKLHMYVNELLERKFRSLELMELEETAVRNYVKSIFSRNSTVRDVYHELEDYLDDSAYFHDLLPGIERVYRKLNKKSTL